MADGQAYIEAAHLAGRRTGDAVAALVSLFNHQGLAALEPRHAGGPSILYDAAAKERVQPRDPALPLYLNPQAEHLLDWFHVTMRITVMSQLANGVPSRYDPILSKTVFDENWSG